MGGEGRVSYDTRALVQRYLTSIRKADLKDKDEVVVIIRKKGAGCLVLMSYIMVELGSEAERCRFFSDMGGRECPK